MLQQNKKTYDIWLPERFWTDHIERDLEGGEAIDCKKHLILVRATVTDLRELLSDATHYEDCTSWANDPNMLGLQRSAQATKKRIENLTRSEGLDLPVPTIIDLRQRDAT
jgi:hypothetical protein